jgi:hypothetical protein
MLAIESAKRRVMHLAERGPALAIGNGQRKDRTRRDGITRHLLTSRFREGSTIDRGAAISLSLSVVAQ